MARVADTGFVQVRAESFDALTPRQKALAYWLTQASIAIDPIIYDQLSRFGLRQKRLFEEILAHPAGIDSQILTRITSFAELFWGNRGNYNDITSQKFLPSFTFDELKEAALTAQRNGAMKTAYGDLPPISTPGQLTKELEDLRASLFDPAFEPMSTAKNPKPGEVIFADSTIGLANGIQNFGLHERLPWKLLLDLVRGQLQSDAVE